MRERVQLAGNQYEVVIENMRTTKWKVSGSVMGQSLQIERCGYNAALAAWREAARRKLEN